MTTSYSKDKQSSIITEVELNITKTEWRTSISQKGFGEVYLTIEGETTGELVTIETCGDGRLGC